MAFLFYICRIQTTVYQSSDIEGGRGGREKPSLLYQVVQQFCKSERYWNPFA